MDFAVRRAIWMVAALGLLLLCPLAGFAADVDTSASVHVAYASGATELDTVKTGVKFFSNKKYVLPDVPQEIDGLTFTRRAGGKPTDVTLAIPAGATVYLLVDTDKGPNAKQKGVVELDASLANSGWARLPDLKGANMFVALFRRDFSASKQMTIPAAGWTGIAVISKSLAVDGAKPIVGGEPTDPEPGPTQPASTVHADMHSGSAPTAGPTTRVSAPQASVKSLEIYRTDAGLMLGQTSEVVLTVTRSDSSKKTDVSFVTPIGNDMALSRDEAMRYIRLTYPNWYVENAEISFEDKYDGHDGGSIGAAVGTMTLSVIQGFKIDPDVAITGDISANGKIRAIGGLAAKLRGAVESKCTLAAIPAENYDQLMDAVIYSGQSMVTDIQVIGVSNLDDAIATVRTDRDAKLTEAIAMFATVQYSLKQSPKYLTTKDAANKLAKVLQLAPQHLSAKVLLAVAQGELPKTLSPAASQYYTYLALNPMFDVLQQRQQSTDAHKLPSGVIRSGLADLRKLRPLADPTVRPLIDAGVRFTQAWNELQQNQGSSQAVETQRQSLLDEMTKENSDPKLMQKMLKEGM